MKLYKSLLLVAAVAGLFSSCSEEGYWDAYDTKSTATYSFEQSANSYSLTAADTLPDLKVTVNRNTNKGEVAVPLNLNFNSDIITVDTNVVIFKDGEFKKDLIINVDESKIVKGFNYKAEISFLVDSVNFFEHNYSISGNNKFTLSFIQKYTWNSIGKALLTDDVVTSPGFGLPQLPPYAVEAEQAAEAPYLIRLKNAYGAAFPYNEPGDYDTKKDYYITFNCEDAEGVYIDGWCEMGMDWGYGMFSVTSYGYYLMANGYSFEEAKATGMMGTLDSDLCITFPVKGLIMEMANWGKANANKNGTFKVDLSTTAIAE